MQINTIPSVLPIKQSEPAINLDWLRNLGIFLWFFGSPGLVEQCIGKTKLYNKLTDRRLWYRGRGRIASRIDLTYYNANR